MEKSLSLGQTGPLALGFTEIQGLYGPITFSEKVLQKIWLKKDFLHHNLHTASGKPLKILHPGQWNRIAGPDFKNAHILLGNEHLYGDIEIHFHPIDWLTHNHHTNPEFNNVILHACLFNSPGNPPAYNSLGYVPETLVLISYLTQSLEEYATEEALLSLENKDYTHDFQAFIQKDLTDISIILQEKALIRWKQKRSFAEYRLSKNSLDETAHQMLLEVLGYRHNRSPMSQIAYEFPFSQFAKNPPTLETLFNSQKENWKLSGSRPANHPEIRLSQYLNLLQYKPNWPTVFFDFAKNLPSHSAKNLSTSQFRKLHNLTTLHSAIKTSILTNSFSGTRLNTIIIDALLPLASAHLNKDFFPLWYHWHSGDAPTKITNFLKNSQLLLLQSKSNGLIQGTLQLFLDSRTL